MTPLIPPPLTHSLPRIPCPPDPTWAPLGLHLKVGTGAEAVRRSVCLSVCLWGPALPTPPLGHSIQPPLSGTEPLCAPEATAATRVRVPSPASAWRNVNEEAVRIPFCHPDSAPPPPGLSLVDLQKPPRPRPSGAEASSHVTPFLVCQHKENRRSGSQSALFPPVVRSAFPPFLI